MVAVAGGRVISVRQRSSSSWSVEFGPAAELVLVSSSVSAGERVPLELPSLLLAFSTTITPESARQALSFTVDGQDWLGGEAPKASLEVGSAEQPVSTAVVRLHPGTPLPAGKPLQLAVSTALTAPDGKH